MYVDRNVVSLNDYKLMAQMLAQTKREYEAQQSKFKYCHSAFFVNPLSSTIRIITMRLQQYNEIITTQATSEGSHQKLTADIKQAIEQYRKQHPKHAAQREQSLQNLTELLQKLEFSDATTNSKYATLTQAIIAELNAVEADHNKDSLSRMFTSSNLAAAYMQVLRDSCIDPGKPTYTLEVELTNLAEARETKTTLTH